MLREPKIKRCVVCGRVIARDVHKCPYCGRRQVSECEMFDEAQGAS